MNGRQVAALAERYGFALFPLRHRSKRPAVKDWENLATSSPQELAATWPTWEPGAGIACGPSGVVGVDLDPPAGTDHFRQLAAGHELPRTLAVRTPRDGLHLVFRAIPGRPIRNSAKRLAADIDTRGHGGYLVAPGSVLDSRAYQEPVELANSGRYVLVDSTPPAPLPAWLADLILARPERRLAGPVRAIASGSRYGLAALRAEADRVRATPEGSRGWTQNAAAFRLGQLAAGGMLAPESIVAALMEASADNGLVAKDGPRCCERSIRGGLAAGMAQPRSRQAAG